MIDEEKKAVEYHKKFVDLILSWNKMEETEMVKNLQITLNLIKKQNKIIEEIKTMYKDFEDDPYFNTDVLFCRLKRILSKGEI